MSRLKSLRSLRNIQNCKSAPFFARDDPNGEKVLIAYLVRKPKNTDITIVALRDFLKQRLPDYMIPPGLSFSRRFP